MSDKPVIEDHRFCNQPSCDGGFVTKSDPSTDEVSPEDLILVAETISAAREQLATTDPTDGHLRADHLAMLILRLLGVDQ